MGDAPPPLWAVLAAALALVLAVVALVTWLSRRNPLGREIARRLAGDAELRRLLRVPGRERTAAQHLRVAEIHLASGDDLPEEARFRAAAGHLRSAAGKAGPAEAAALWERLALGWEGAGRASGAAVDWWQAKEAWGRAAALAPEGAERARLEARREKAADEESRLLSEGPSPYFGG